MILKKMKILIEIDLCSKEIAESVLRAVKPEDKLAPEIIELNSFLENGKIIFLCEADFEKKDNLKISTIKRTVDDWIWSISISYKTLRSIE